MRCGAEACVWASKQKTLHQRLAAFLDLVGTNQQLAEWIASSAKYRTVVANSTSREITK
jgi:hypothetical protein